MAANSARSSWLLWRLLLESAFLVKHLKFFFPDFFADVQLLDVKSTSAFPLVHFPGSFFLPLDLPPIYHLPDAAELFWRCLFAWCRVGELNSWRWCWRAWTLTTILWTDIISMFFKYYMYFLYAAHIFCSIKNAIHLHNLHMCNLSICVGIRTLDPSGCSANTLTTIL